MSTPKPWQNRIIGEGECQPDQLLANPSNWRIHPKNQQDALSGALDNIGWLQRVIVNKRSSDEWPEGERHVETMLDGHLRVELAISKGEPAVPVSYVDLSPNEEALALATFDPIGALAATDKDQLEALMRQIDTPDERLQQMLTDLAEEHGVIPSMNEGEAGAADSGDAQPVDLKSLYMVLRECDSEAEQLRVIAEMREAGHPCRAIVSSCQTQSEDDAERVLEPVQPGATEVATEALEIQRTPRVIQVEGMFDVAPEPTQQQRWSVSCELPDEWHVGVIYGPSGSGKTTLAKSLFGADAMIESWGWPANGSILDGFPESMPVSDVVGLLSSVGLSSPPAWLRPYRVLSNGQRFRSDLARSLAEQPALAVVDEFTSVVDRTVAKTCSVAVSKAVRRTNRRIVLCSCHDDILEWLQPDWVLNVQPDSAELERRSVRRHPPVHLRIVRADRNEWKRFRGHHYLSGNLHTSSKCFVGLVRMGDSEAERPAVFTAVLSFPHPTHPRWREHRTVCLPDYQGCGIGNAMSSRIAAAMFATGKEYMSTTSHPAMSAYRNRSPDWRMVRKPSLVQGGSETTNQGLAATLSFDRVTAGFVYCGAPDTTAARELGII